MDYIDFLKQAEKRERLIVKAYLKGKTTSEIAPEYGVSRQRIQQILARNGIGRNEGGATVRSEKRKEKFFKARNKRYLKSYGCTFNEVMEIRAKYGNRPFRAYACHKRNAKTRNIDWKFNFIQWWKVWELSGKWSKCGRGNGKYNMARFRDIGPYETGNVRILSVENNVAEYYANHKEEHRILSAAAENKKRKKHGTGHGKTGSNRSPS